MRLDEIPEGCANQYEALVDMSTFELDAGVQWRPISKLSPASKFPVVVVGGKFRLDEVRNVRPKGGDA